MTLVNQLILFFESIFKRSDPEVQKKLKLKNIENELKDSTPNLYKSKQLQPIFAQAFFLLYKNTQKINKYISFASDISDASIKEKIFLTLIQTGYNDTDFIQNQLLTFEEKKKRMREAKNTNEETEYQKRNLENHIKVLHTKPFQIIQVTLQNFDIFLNICSFNYMNCIRFFAPNYKKKSNESPNFVPLDIEKAETILQDFYYVIKNLTIDGALARAIIAAIKITNRATLSDKTITEITMCIKTIAAVINQVLTTANIKKLLYISKKNPKYEPQAMVVKNDYLMLYSEKIKRTFKEETNRISTELQDSTLKVIIEKLFGVHPLLHLEGYNQTMNEYLQENTSCSFLWITPLEIVKSFLSLFFTDSISSLLNDIVLEGFFLDTTNKSLFSSLIYSCNVFPKKFEAFEATFGIKGENSKELIQGYVRDSQLDTEFEKTLQILVDKINLTAKELVQNISQNLAQLYIKMDNIIKDSKKTSPDEVENIKVLFQSSRNHENADFLEKSMPKWKLFITIMKNYAIIDGA